VSLPLVVIVGAPNVGKSTLFNRLVGRRRAIVTDEPGVTRDRLFGEVRSGSPPFAIVDTGGLTPGEDTPFAREIEQQAEIALADAAVILLVVDARAGATGLDLDLAQMLRRRSQPLLLVANKVDAESSRTHLQELHRLGLGEPLAVSAEHGRGVGELLEQIEEHLEREATSVTAAEPDDAPVGVAIVGRPNVGKSSLLNRLVGEERMVVSDIPGTTRDAIDTLLRLDRRSYRLIDTAGIRRRGKPQRKAERFSVDHARRNIERCDVAVLVLDATEELAAQDAHIAGYVRDAYKPMLVAVNKWDLVSEREQAAKSWDAEIRRRLKFAKDVPLILISAKSGQRVSGVLERVDALHAEAGRHVSTVELNRWLEGQRGPDGSLRGGGHRARAYYVTQTGVHPPRILIFCNDPRRVHFSVRRHLENSLRERFDFGSAPIRLVLRSRRENR